jgi:putative RNA 2'-phosphotransferase
MPIENRVALSKTISHALRHAPDQYGLELDEAGWVDVAELTRALVVLRGAR